MQKQSSFFGHPRLFLFSDISCHFGPPFPKATEKTATRSESTDWGEVGAPEETEATEQAVSAHITAKRIGESQTGLRVVSKIVDYYVTFHTEDGETQEFAVSQELFERVHIHDTGMLVTVHGNFFDFGDGEEIIKDDLECQKKRQIFSKKVQKSIDKRKMICYNNIRCERDEKC